MSVNAKTKHGMPVKWEDGVWTCPDPMLLEQLEHEVEVMVREVRAGAYYPSIPMTACYRLGLIVERDEKAEAEASKLGLDA